MKMNIGYELWLAQVREALLSINMDVDDWQSIWPFDFKAEHRAGTNPVDSAEKANRFWWYQQNKSLNENCEITPNCWLRRGHQGVCKPVA